MDEYADATITTTERMDRTEYLFLNHGSRHEEEVEEEKESDLFMTDQQNLQRALSRKSQFNVVGVGV